MNLIVISYLLLGLVTSRPQATARSQQVISNSIYSSPQAAAPNGLLLPPSNLQKLAQITPTTQLGQPAAHFSATQNTLSNLTTSRTFIKMQQQQQQQMQNTNDNQAKAGQTTYSSKNAQAWQVRNLNKFQRYLSEHQQELVRRNPGSLWAVARAIKMAILECRHQMRNELWNCTTYGFSPKITETFGMLMSRSFKETSFVQSLLSAAIAHSVARACTESDIKTCSRRHSPHGRGFKEDIEFGRLFSRDFLDVSNELQQQLQLQHTDQLLSNNLISTSATSNGQLPSSNKLNSFVSTNSITPPESLSGGGLDSAQYQFRVTSGRSGSGMGGPSRAPVWKEKRLRQMINEHNDEVGRLVSSRFTTLLLDLGLHSQSRSHSHSHSHRAVSQFLVSSSRSCRGPLANKQIWQLPIAISSAEIALSPASCALWLLFFVFSLDYIWRPCPALLARVQARCEQEQRRGWSSRAKIPVRNWNAKKKPTKSVKPKVDLSSGSLSLICHIDERDQEATFPKAPETRTVGQHPG